jgi:hypothetical protein
MAEVRVIPPAERDDSTAQTFGLQRFEAVSSKLTGAKELWMGLSILPADGRTGVHHHGDSETALYVLRGVGRCGSATSSIAPVRPTPATSSSSHRTLSIGGERQRHRTGRDDVVRTWSGWRAGRHPPASPRRGSSRPHAVGEQVGGGDHPAPVRHPDLAKHLPQRLVVRFWVDPLPDTNLSVPVESRRRAGRRRPGRRGAPGRPAADPWRRRWPWPPGAGRRSTARPWTSTVTKP